MILVIALYGQTRSIRFDNYTIEEGLTQSSVNAMIEDRQGFIWIGTQDGLHRFDGYSFQIFKHEPSNINSLSNSYIKNIIQDDNGLFWIGTESGGVNVFDPKRGSFKRLKGHDILERGQITSLTIDKEGSLWVASGTGGVLKFLPKDSTIIEYGPAQGLGTAKVNKLAVNNRGDILVGSQGKGLYVLQKNHKSFDNFRYDKEDNRSINGSFVNDIFQDSKGRTWIATNKGISQFNGNQFERYGTKDGLSGENVNVVFTEKSGTIWCGYEGKGLDQILIKDRKIHVNNFTNNDFDKTSLSHNIVYSMLEDNSGSIWIGTNGGVSKFDPLKQAFEHIKDDFGDEGLLDDNIWTIKKDQNGIVWAGTREGIARIDRENVQVNNYPFKGSNPDEPNNNSINAIEFGIDGTVWAGSIDGLYKVELSQDLKTAKYVPVFFRENHIEHTRVYEMIKDREFLWIACREGLGRFNTATGEALFFEHSIDDPNSLPTNICRSIMMDSKKNYWIATEEGLCKLVVTKEKDNEQFKFTTFRHNPSDPNSISSDLILSIWEESDGSIWTGTYGGGLNRLDPVTKRFKAYTEKDGLPNNSVYGVIGGEKRSIWMSTNLGICRFDIASEAFTTFLNTDGLQSNEFNTGAYHRSDNGELFFGGINGFNAFYPKDIRKNKTPPRMAIIDIMLFNKSLDPQISDVIRYTPSYSKEIVLDHTQSNITFGYSALHYTQPQGNRYKYILEGDEENYNDVGNRREAHYTHLAPGEYTFKVYGANSDGFWSDQPATIHIIVTPPFWQTWWFRSLLIIAVILLIIVLQRWRINSIKIQKETLARLVELRTRTVTEQKEQIEEQKSSLEKQKALMELEKNKADKLLANILPGETAEELKNKGKARTRNYKRVSVIFTDFVGFTTHAEVIKPQDLVRILDNYFKEFDKIVESNHVEKIKTIGDAYMAAGGIPLRDRENPINTVIAGLQIQNYVKTNRENSINGGTPEEGWELRVGVHTGEVIAGVIGTKRIAYDIWGNSVNVAARMEQSGEVGKVNISGKTFEYIEPYFDCTYRGKIPAKNKGHIDMYFVEGIKPHLSENGDGVTPNRRFWDYVNLHVYSAINYQKAERHIMRILKQKLSPKLYYHGIHHTYDVVKAAERIAIMEGVLDEDIFVLKSAATYHDAGFVEQYDANEPIGANMAAEILPKYGYTPEQVEMVFKLIYATIIPHNPQSQLEEIICDADLDYLGRDDFHEISDTLRVELKEHGKINSDRLWDEIQVKFLTMHKYFTKSAIELRQAKKMKHLEEIKNRLKENNYKD